MAISDKDKMRSRHHLGYLNAGLASTFLLGVPAMVQTQYLIENSFNKILPEAEEKFVQLLDTCDEYEGQWRENKDLRDVNQVGSIQIRPDAFQASQKEYLYWRAALGNLLGVPPNPYDMRFNEQAGVVGLNIPVMNG